MRLILACLLIFFSCTAYAAQPAWKGTLVVQYEGVTKTIKGLPEFGDFPPVRTAKKQARDIVFSSNRYARKYRTALREGLKEGANFNGHYRIVTVGCGSSCQLNWVLDIETGRVLQDFYTSHGVIYRQDSALFIKDLWEHEDPVDLAAWYIMTDPIEYRAVKKGRVVTLRVIDACGMIEDMQR